MTRKKLQEIVSKMQINYTAFEEQYALSNKIFIDLFKAKYFGEKRINLLYDALKAYKKKISEIIQ